MNETGDLFMGREAEAIQHPAVIGIPLGQPGGAIAHGLGGDDQIHADCARRQHLLPFGDLHMGRGARHDASSRCRMSRRRLTRFPARAGAQARPTRGCRRRPGQVAARDLPRRRAVRAAPTQRPRCTGADVTRRRRRSLLRTTDEETYGSPPEKPMVRAARRSWPLARPDARCGAPQHRQLVMDLLACPWVFPFYSRVIANCPSARKARRMRRVFG